MYKKIIEINVEKDLSVIAIVGEKMKNTPGISANLFKAVKLGFHVTVLKKVIIISSPKEKDGFAIILPVCFI